MATFPFQISEDEYKRLVGELTSGVPPQRKRCRTRDVLEMDYQTQYLRTKRWREIKARILLRDNRICQSCGGKGEYVHHLAYTREVLEGHTDDLLATVCDGCHSVMHVDDDGRRRTLDEANTILRTGLRSTEVPEPDVNLNRIMPPKMPPEWNRMTALQKDIWHKRAREIWLERITAKKKRAEKRKKAT